MHLIKDLVSSIVLQISLSFILYIIFLIILRLVLKKLIPKIYPHKTIIAENILRVIFSPLFLAISASILSVIIERFCHFLGFEFPIGRTINIVLTIAVGWAIYNFVDAAYNIYLDKLEATKQHRTKRRTMLQLFYVRRTAHIAIFLLTLAVALLNIPAVKSVAVTALASAGILTAIIGFASQNWISTLLSGFQITFVQPINLDDTVMIEGILGTVEEINLSYVVVRSWDQRAFIYPTTYFFKNVFQNWSHQTKYLIGTLFLTVNLNTDIDIIRQEFLHLLSTSSLWTKDVGKMWITGQDDNSMKLRFTFSAKDSSEMSELEYILREKLIVFLRTKFAEPFPVTRYREVNNTR